MKLAITHGELYVLTESTYTNCVGCCEQNKRAYKCVDHGLFVFNDNGTPQHECIINLQD